MITKIYFVLGFMVCMILVPITMLINSCSKAINSIEARWMGVIYKLLNKYSGGIDTKEYRDLMDAIYYQNVIMFERRNKLFKEKAGL